ncbi:AAA family ATPase [Vibrio sp. S4M6]|uniref:AAA family ATPase n=1 Tax=Vibrio sinus TaxID=2946865 RepID=UPI00202A5901|nr:AAA family ATPase [Vibrio sinus]MCL9781426.1 AAA family ATPase [Vibrio sinus]
MGEAVKLSRNEENTLRLKTNLSIWVFYSSDQFRTHISNELSNCESITFETISLHSLVVSNLSQFNPPDLIFVETGPNWAQKIVELQQYEGPINEGHEASLIVFGNESDNGALKIALRIGAADFVSDQIGFSDLIPMLKSVAEDKVASRDLGELYVFVNSKGGAGASTIAMNTALSLSKVMPEKVLLLDLDLQFGVIDDYLNLASKYTLTDAIANASDMDEVSLGAIVTKHSSGLHILGFQHENSQENYEKAHHISKLLPVLREVYDYIIVDMSRGVDRLFSPIINPAQKVFLITQQNLVAIRNSTRIAKVLALEFGIGKDNLEIVVNRYEKRQSIKIKDIEGTIVGVQVHVIPNDFKVAFESANLGRPFVETKKKSAIAKAVKEFTTTLLPQEESDKKQGFISRLFS